MDTPKKKKRKIINFQDSTPNETDNFHSEPTQDTTQRPFDIYPEGETPSDAWVGKMVELSQVEPAMIVKIIVAPNAIPAVIKKPETKVTTGGHDVSTRKMQQNEINRQATTSGRAQVPTGGHAAAKKAQVAIKNSSRSKKKSDVGGPKLKPGEFVRANYRTTNRDTSAGTETRTLLIISKGTSDETPFYKPHLPIKEGYWCMHLNKRKFFFWERFSSIKRIDALEALKQKDSPIVLRASYQKDVQETLETLRRVNGSLTYNNASLHLHATAILDDMFED